jgi:hypothetical protein
LEVFSIISRSKKAKQTTLLQLIFTKLPMSSSQKTVLKSKVPICVGDKVSVRDKPNSSWLKGEVISLNPMEVQVDGWPVPMSFKFVRREKKAADQKIADEATCASAVKSTSLKWIRFKWIACSDLPHLLGKQGKRLKRIQEEFKNCKISIIDENTVSYDYRAEMEIEKRNEYFGRYGHTAFNVWGNRNALVQVISTRSEQEANEVCREVCKFRREMSIWRYKYKKYLYWKRNQHRDDYDSRKEAWAHDHELWFLQKEQHGANGEWFTRKFKNKGRDRGNRKFRKSNKQTQQRKIRKSRKQLQRKKFRKSGKREKFIREISAARRFSL